SLLAVGTRDGRIFLWDVAVGERVETLIGHTDWVESVAFSPDGSLLASGASNGTIFVWDIETGEKVETLAGQGGIISLSFSPDSTLLAW
ncbi:WD40 repeat domain-containing protein, partial [Methylobacterium crusticola]